MQINWFVEIYSACMFISYVAKKVLLSELWLSKNKFKNLTCMTLKYVYLNTCALSKNIIKFSFR